MMQNCIVNVLVWAANERIKLRYQVGGWICEPGTHKTGLELKQGVWEMQHTAGFKNKAMNELT